MADRVYNVLFLCTGNSARSLMAECAINRWGAGRFRGFSAGSHPKGRIHPMTLRLLERLNYRTFGLRSKSWDEFADGSGPPLDFVFTVCDQAAGEVCSAWPGQPMTAHWGVPDPAAFVGSDDQTYRFFRNVHGQLENRIKIFTSLPIAGLDRLALQRRLDEIGRSPAEPARASSISICRAGWRRKRSAPHSCSRPWSARGSWPRRWPAAISRSPCSATRSRPARSWS